MRIIKNIESTSVGKTRIKNDDGIYIGTNFAAVIDGVSSKSSIIVNGKKVRIADIIIDAIKKIDNDNAPKYAKEFDLDEFLKIINMYISKYCEKFGISLKDNKLEATGAIYSKYNNQIWIIGDCRAVYDGKQITNDLEADELYTKIRIEIINSLLKQGYTIQDIFENDVSVDIINNPDTCTEYIQDEKEANRIKEFIKDQMHMALLETGFDEEQIISENLLSTFYKPQILQEYSKNNPNAKKYGYSVFNGIYTPTKWCKVESLPDKVKKIKLSTDGFPIDILNYSKDLGQAIRRNKKLTKIDPISIKENIGIHNSVIKNEEYIMNDDESAIDIMIEEVKKEKVKEELEK